MTEDIIEFCLNPTFQDVCDRMDVLRQTLHQFISNKVTNLTDDGDLECDIVLDEGQGLSDSQKARITRITLDPTYGSVYLTDDMDATYDMADEATDTIFVIANQLNEY